MYSAKKEGEPNSASNLSKGKQSASSGHKPKKVRKVTNSVNTGHIPYLNPVNVSRRGTSQLMKQSENQKVSTPSGGTKNQTPRFQ